MQLTIDEARRLADDILSAHGVSASNRAVLADLIVLAETSGSRSHGLLRLPDYVASIRAGWLDPSAEPHVVDVSEVLITADCNNGFTQVAAVAARDLLVRKACSHGIAALAVRNGHHVGALWLDVEPLAQAGLVAMDCVNSRCWIAPYGASRRLLGTNAMAFGFPDGKGGTVCWDQASSVMSVGDIKLHAMDGRPLPEGVAIDSTGLITTDASSVFKGGAVLPFACHKGASIALMVEVLAAAVSGGNFGFEDKSPNFPGASSSNAGQFLLVIDPRRTAGGGFAARIEKFLDFLRAEPGVRLPGDRRKSHRDASARAGVTLSEAEYVALQKCLKTPPA